jgi:GntR family transcriptional regulator
MIDKDSRIPLYIQLKDHLLEGIVSGKYPPGSQLPTEKELIHSLKLGRATVRAAFYELEREGVIIKRHGIGSFVTDKSGRTAFEPMISLSYMLELLGVKSFNRVEFDREIEVSAPPLSEKWSKGAKVHHLHRIRFAADQPIALEDDFLPVATYEKLSGCDFSDSLAHVLLKEIKIPVEKIEQTILMRAPTGDEKASLSLGPDEQVLEMKRWLYEAGNGVPISYLYFVMPDGLFQVPYEMFRRGRQANV